MSAGGYSGCWLVVSGFYWPLNGGAGLEVGFTFVEVEVSSALLGYRVYRLARFKGFDNKDAIFYALFCGVLEKYPKLLGQIQFHINRLLKRQRTLVEYKSAPSAS